METHQLLHLASRRVELMKAAAVHIGVTSRTNDHFMHPITVGLEQNEKQVVFFPSLWQIPNPLLTAVCTFADITYRRVCGCEVTQSRVSCV